MEWDYDKLFADGNYVGIKNPNTGKVWYQLVDYDWDDIDWDDYKNENLASEIDNHWAVCRIIQLNDEGEITEVIFDREKDTPMPELKDGMMIWVKTDYDKKPHIGIVVGNNVYYQDGGYDDIEGEDGIKNDIVSVYNHGCGFACAIAKPIWGKDMIDDINQLKFEV